MPSAPHPKVVAVLLAAGAGHRFDGPTHKLLATIDGVPIWQHALSAALGANVPVVLVTGAAELAPIPPTVTVVHNSNWQQGQAGSLTLGIQAARDLGAEVVVTGLADQPGVSASAWRRLTQHTADLAVATYDGQRGHPVRIAHTYWPELPTHGDLGARDVLARHADAVEQIPCEGSPDDIDTAKDLERWLRRSPTSSP
jgi:molybdenum cofactor cytidylyltransferase